MLTDIEIAQQAELLPIREIAQKVDIQEEDLEYYGRYKAKLSESLFKKLERKPDGSIRC